MNAPKWRKAAGINGLPQTYVIPLVWKSWESKTFTKQWEKKGVPY